MNVGMVENLNTDNATIKVVIADDHNLLRHAVRGILETESRYLIVGEASTAEQAIALVEKEHPDILILDLGLPQRSGMDVIHELKGKKIHTKIVILSMYDDEIKVKQALASGSDGYLLKDFSPDEFLIAMNSVVSGKKVVPPKFNHLLTQVSDPSSKNANGSSSTATDPLEILSPREREMFFLLVEGLPNRARVIKKLQLSSNADLIRYAIKHGLVIV